MNLPDLAQVAHFLLLLTGEQQTEGFRGSDERRFFLAKAVANLVLNVGRTNDHKELCPARKEFFGDENPEVGALRIEVLDTSEGGTI